MAEPEVRIEHPNRRKAAWKLTRAVVVLLLLASAVLVAIVAVGSWDVLQGAKALQIAYIVAMSGFRQVGNVEVQHPVDEPPRPRPDRGDPAPAAA